MSEFRIRRGQVFYISKDAQSGAQPYIVLSNNKCNETSDAVHVAPIRAGLADMNKYYQCPFTGTCNRDMFVDAAKTTLVSKNLLVEANYSAAMSYYTVNNSYLITRIEEALCQQLGITKNYVVYGDTEPTEKKPEPIQVTINMNITGMDGASPVTVTAEPVITAVQKKEPDVFIEPEMAQESIDKTLEASKIVDIKQVNATRYNRVHSKHAGYHRTVLSKKEQDDLINTIMNESKSFGGKLSTNQIADKLGLSYVTVYRYTKELVKNGGTIKVGRTKKENAKETMHSPLGFAHRRCEHILVKSTYKNISTSTLEKAVDFFNEGGAQLVLEKLPNTFQNEHAVRNFIFRNCAKVEGDK